VTILTFTAIFGIITLMSAPILGGITNHSILVFVGFGLADVSFDCLLIPGRALIDDLAVGREEEANSLFTGFQLIGRLIALALGASGLTSSGLFGIYRGIDAHFNAMFMLSALFLISSLILVTIFVRDDGVVNHDISSSSKERIPIITQNEEINIHRADLFNYEAIPKVTNGRIVSDVNHDINRFYDFKVCASVLLCSVQAMGWMGICAQSFFWTAWRGEEIGCTDLALQAVVGLITTAFIPKLNEYFGAVHVWCSSELFFHLLMISTAFVPSSNIPRIICMFTGINYAVHATNGLTVAASVFGDPMYRARTIAMVNITLPMGQLITAIFGGTIAQYFGGFRHVFIVFGVLGFIVTSLVWAVSSRKRIFDE